MKKKKNGLEIDGRFAWRWTYFSAVEELICNIYAFGHSPPSGPAYPCFNIHFHLAHAQRCFHKVRIRYTNPVESQKYVLAGKWPRAFQASGEHVETPPKQCEALDASERSMASTSASQRSFLHLTSPCSIVNLSATISFPQPYTCIWLLGLAP